MRALKILTLVLVSIASMSLFEQKAEAGSSFYLSFASHHPYNRGYYRPYYRPYYYRPYGFGYGYGYGGYGYGGYGYGYPYGYYNSYYNGLGEVRTEVKPDEAKVYLDGDYVGVADDFNSWYQRMNLDPGKYRLVFRLNGFQPYAMTLRVLPGQDYHIKHQLIPGEDVIPESEMRLSPQEAPRSRDYDRNNNYDRQRNHDDDYNDDNGQFGSNGGSNGRDEQFDRRGQSAQRDQYNSEPAPLEYELGEQAQSGKTMFTIQVEPKDATIYIDGTYYGTGDAQSSNQIQVLLANGTHKLEVVRPGFESFSKDFVVNESAARNITIQLEKK